MAALTFTDDVTGSVTFRKAIFRLILERARARVTDPADLAELEMSEAMEGISFNLLPSAQRSRLAAAVTGAVTSLKDDIAAGRPLAEPVLPGAQDKLDETLALLARFSA